MKKVLKLLGIIALVAVIGFSMATCDNGNDNGGGGGGTYTVTVNGGSGSGSYAAGATVNITATVPQGQQFVNWTTTSSGVTFANANSQSTTFTMPSNAVIVTANFEAIQNTYFGIWIGSNTNEYEFGDDYFRYKSGIHEFECLNLTWTAVTSDDVPDFVFNWGYSKDDYPNGYIITGTVNQISGSFNRDTQYVFIDPTDSSKMYFYHGGNSGLILNKTEP